MESLSNLARYTTESSRHGPLANACGTDTSATTRPITGDEKRSDIFAKQLANPPSRCYRPDPTGVQAWNALPRTLLLVFSLPRLLIRPPVQRLCAVHLQMRFAPLSTGREGLPVHHLEKGDSSLH